MKTVLSDLAGRRTGAKVGIALITALGAVIADTVRADAIDDLPPGHWYEIPRSTLASVAPNPTPPGVQGTDSVITQASGGAYDPKRDLLIVWGGGATSYAGNEVYAFDMKKLAWRRLTEPSKDVGGYERSGYYPDGQPRSRHTYDVLEYVPPLDRFCSFSALSMYPSGVTTTGNVDCLDLDTGKWERKANAINYFFGAMTAYDPVTKRVWMHGAGNNGYLTSYDPVTNRWHAHGRPGFENRFISTEPTAAIDPVRRKFVAVGGGEVLVWDIGARGLIKARELKTKGDAGIVFSKSPGFEYDPVLKKFVAWSGGADVYIFDLDRAEWTKQEPAPGNKVRPSTATQRGTFGRFRYVPSKNVYVVVNDIRENVFVYRLTSNKK